MTARALDLVGGAPPGVAIPSVRIAAARFLDPRPGSDCRVEFGDRSAALVVMSRRAFDGYLLNQAVEAGATFVPSRVRRVEPASAPARFRLITATAGYTCRRLVGADGANSLVRRTLDRPFSRRQLSVATGFYARGRTTSDIALEFVADPPGYLWSFPRPDHLAIGICGQADHASVETLRARARQWVERTALCPGAPLEPYAWPIPSLDVASLQQLVLGGRGWLLVGDAAGLVDPITREGIYYALLSASCAADALLEALGRAEADVLGRYASAVGRQIVPELTRAAQLKAGFFRPGFTDLVLDALRRSIRVRRVMADLVAGVQPYRGLRRRLLATREIRLALRLVRDRWRSNRRAHEPAAGAG